MKILTADDGLTDRLILTATLTKLGHEVIETSNGIEAWTAFEKEPVPVLISDVMMPQMDGLELCRRVRAARRDKYTYVILLTAHGSRGLFAAGMEAGADDFISKPFDEEQLAARLHVAERIIRLQVEVSHLSGLLPICAYCKQVRDDRDYWHQVESYIATRTGARFSHGVCPTCWETHVKREFREIGLDAGPYPDGPAPSGEADGSR